MNNNDANWANVLERLTASAGNIITALNPPRSTNQQVQNAVRPATSTGLNQNWLLAGAGVLTVLLIVLIARR